MTPFCNSPIKPHTIFSPEGKENFQDFYKKEYALQQYLYTNEKEIKEATEKVMENYVCPGCFKKLSQGIDPKKVVAFDHPVFSIPAPKESLFERLKSKFKKRTEKNK